MKQDCEVVVIGGGPAGLVAARDLARAGRGVIVLEEHAAIGYPVHCTGLVGLDAFDELGLSCESVRSVVTSAAFCLNHGTPLVVRNERVRAAIIDRAVFDARLAQEARRAGAMIETNARVQHVHASAAAVTADLQDGRGIRARAAVLACGVNYRFNRALGFGVPRAYLQTAQVEIPRRLADHVTVHFGSGLAPGGFGWVVPFERDGEGQSRVGLMCRDRVVHRFRAFRETVASLAGSDVWDWPEPRLRLLPLGPVRRTYATRVLAVGDAAGLVKPTTGGGIYYGLLTGAMAARVLSPRLADDRLLAGDLLPYEQMWRARMGPEIRVGLAFRSLATRLSDRAIQALLELARVDGLIPLLNEHADFNWHHGAALALLRSPSFRRVLVTHLWS